jgi:hypothetical protein
MRSPPIPPLLPLLLLGETFRVTADELSNTDETHGARVTQLLKQVAKISRGAWKHRADSREAVHWREGTLVAKESADDR